MGLRVYLRGVLIGLDQFVNSLFGGYPDETISGRWGRERKLGDDLADVGCSVLDRLDPDHCAVSIEELPDGTTDPHHLGRVIRELPPKPKVGPNHKDGCDGKTWRYSGDGYNRVRLCACGAEDHAPTSTAEPPAERLNAKVRSFGLCAAFGLLMLGCPIRIVIPAPPVPVPSPIPVPSPVVTPSPQPSPQVSPLPSPLPPSASPAPCVVEPVPGCAKPDGCTFCSEWIAWSLQGGHLQRLSNSRFLFNDPGGNASEREYVDPQTCFMVWPDGTLRNKRYHRDGTICPDCPPAPSPSPCASPTPKPPTPPPGGPCVAPPLTASGNYPLPPAGECPCWFRALPFSLHLKVNTPRPCGEGTVCRRVNSSVTQRVAKPGLEHTCLDEDGAYSLSNCKSVGEMLRACQEPQFVDYVGGPEDNPGNGVLMVLSGNVEYGRCDKQTCDPRFDACPPGMTNPVHNFNCHDKAVDRAGFTTIKACMPDRTNCTEARYRTDQ